MIATADDRGLEQFLAYIREVANREGRNYDTEIGIVHREERWIFHLFLAAAVIALLIVTAGAVLLFVAKLAMGSITAMLGALTGRGTYLLRTHASSLRAKRELIQDQQRDSQQTLLAIQAALAIPDATQRSTAMSNITARLLARVTGIAGT
jgi:hypothetical protein